jgi:hypothetical protein
MPGKRRKIDAIPEAFESPEQAGAFWDTHDTVDYADAFTEVSDEVELKGRRFEIEIDANVMDLLRKKARRARTDAGRLASRLLRKELKAS